MQKNIAIFLILHIFIYLVILLLNSPEVVQKCFYFLCLLNYVYVQISTFWFLRLESSIQAIFTSNSDFQAVFYPLVELMLLFFLSLVAKQFEHWIVLCSWPRNL